MFDERSTTVVEWFDERSTNNNLSVVGHRRKQKLTAIYISYKPYCY